MNTQQIDMTTTDTNTTSATRRRLVAFAILTALALSFAAAFAAIGADPIVTSDGIFASVGDYITAVGEALGGG